MTSSAEPEFDLDEDLFGFEPVPEDEGDFENLDLDSIFEEFESLEKKEEELEAAAEAEAAVAAAEAAFDEEATAALSEEAPLVADGTADESIFAEEPGDAQPRPGAAPVAQGAPLDPQPSVQQVVLTPADAAGGKRQVLSKSALLILMSLTSLNALVAIVTLTRASEMSRVGERMMELAQEIQVTPAPVVSVEEDEPVVPLTAPSPDEHPTLLQATDAIRQGDYAAARQRIYGLLAVIDRIDESTRREVESHAQFLLAEAAHMQALTSMEGDR